MKPISNLMTMSVIIFAVPGGLCRSCRCSMPVYMYVCGAISALDVRCGVRACVSTCAPLRRRCSRRARSQKRIQLGIGLATPVYIQDTNLAQSRISSAPSLLPPRDLLTTVARSLFHQPHNHAMPIPINYPFVTINYPFVTINYQFVTRAREASEAGKNPRNSSKRHKFKRGNDNVKVSALDIPQLRRALLLGTPDHEHAHRHTT